MRIPSRCQPACASSQLRGGCNNRSYFAARYKQHFKIYLGNAGKSRILKTEMSERPRQGPPNHILSELGAIPIVEILGGDQLSHPGCEVMHFYIRSYSHFVQISSQYNTPPRHGPQPAPYPVLSACTWPPSVHLLRPFMYSCRYLFLPAVVVEVRATSAKKTRLNRVQHTTRPTSTNGKKEKQHPPVIGPRRAVKEHRQTEQTCPVGPGRDLSPSHQSPITRFDFPRSLLAAWEKHTSRPSAHEINFSDTNVVSALCMPPCFTPPALSSLGGDQEIPE